MRLLLIMVEYTKGAISSCADATPGSRGTHAGFVEGLNSNLLLNLPLGNV